MKVVVAPNALKGSLDAFAACSAIADGVRRALPGARCVLLPLADGGDGTSAVLAAHAGAESMTATTCDALGRPVQAKWAWIEATRTAVLDVASASGLSLLPLALRDPAQTSSFGTGLLLRAALDRGARRVLIGLGGSATVDAGMGLAEALGVYGVNASGARLPRGGLALRGLARIDFAAMHVALRAASGPGAVELVCLCDVQNPLTGPDGAAQVFAPQKGADAALTRALADNLEHVAEVWRRDLGMELRGVPRAGAAGGLAAGLAAMFGAELRAGIDEVLDAVEFGKALRGADLVITCEGQLDAQTLHNKAPQGIARAARAAGVPVIMLVGGIDGALSPDQLACFDAVLSIAPGPIDLASAMARAGELLGRAAEQALRLVLLGLTLQPGGAQPGLDAPDDEGPGASGRSQRSTLGPDPV
jgi:glycerate kinase